VSHSTDVGCISEENTYEEATSNWNCCAANCIADRATRLLMLLMSAGSTVIGIRADAQTTSLPMADGMSIASSAFVLVVMATAKTKRLFLAGVAALFLAHMCAILGAPWPWRLRAMRCVAVAIGERAAVLAGGGSHKSTRFLVALARS
jgi:hypothetical protein